jgi:CBS domain-containing protein
VKKTLVKEFHPYEKPSIIGENADIEDMIRHFVEYPRIHHLCVVDKDMKLLGLINRKRMFKIIFSHYATSVSKFSSLFTLHTAKTSGEIMITHIISTSEDATTDSVIHLLAEHNIREIPVVDAHNRVLGFISSLSIMEEWLREKESQKE